MDISFCYELCPLCGGERDIGETIYSVDLGFGIVVVRKVPARVCIQCGEEWIDAETARTLELIIENAREQKPQLEVLQYQEVTV